MEKSTHNSDIAAQPQERFVVNVNGAPRALRDLSDEELGKLSTDANSQMNQLSHQMHQIDAQRIVAVQMMALASYEAERRAKSIQIAHALPH